MSATFAPETSTRGHAPSLMGMGQLVTLSIIHVICGTIFAFDVIGEIHTNLTSLDPEAKHSLPHLVLEVFAMSLMLSAFIISSRQILRHRAALSRAKDRLEGVSSDFSGLVARRFQEWKLSPAETEIALLTIKGLRIAEIAHIRGGSEGTVKSHLTAIFRKSGTTSRPELLAHFVDDFLDLSTRD